MVKHMSHKIFCCALCALLLTLSFPVLAQQPAKVPRIGMFLVSTPSATAHLVEAFRQGLRHLGYIEGQNIAIESRFGEGKVDRLPDLAADMVHSNVDVIVAATPPAILATKQATKTIPIVMVATGDPVALGFVTSLARPGGNITGLTILSVELSGKQLELLTEVVPRASLVAVLWNPKSPDTELAFKETEAAAKAQNVKLLPLAVQRGEDFNSVFQEASKHRPNALIVLQDSLTFTHRKQIVDLAAKKRLPAIYGLTESAEAGGLMAYGPNRVDQYRRAATYIDKILKGAKPADLPVEQPTKFELVINLKAAKQIGLTIPPSVLYQADRVIK
jgi:putative tryptophan/tyrosine transport system substrate-binding protein